MNEILIPIFTALGEEHFFSARLPSRFTIKKFITNEEDKKHLLEGLIEANVLCLIFTFAVYYITKNNLVFIFGIGTALLMSLLYLNDMEIIKFY